MKTLLRPFFVLVIFGTVAIFPLPYPVLAADCNVAASNLAASKGGEVLNVVARQKDGKLDCEITLRLPGKDGQPPRVVTSNISG
jgi:hypothetical protein